MDSRSSRTIIRDETIARRLPVWENAEDFFTWLNRSGIGYAVFGGAVGERMGGPDTEDLDIVIRCRRNFRRVVETSAIFCIDSVTPVDESTRDVGYSRTIHGSRHASLTIRGKDGRRLKVDILNELPPCNHDFDVNQLVYERNRLFTRSDSFVLFDIIEHIRRRETRSMYHSRECTLETLYFLERCLKMMNKGYKIMDAPRFVKASEENLCCICYECDGRCAEEVPEEEVAPPYELVSTVQNTMPVLECGHAFCIMCLKGMLVEHTSSHRSSIRCPLCRDRLRFATEEEQSLVTLGFVDET